MKKTINECVGCTDLGLSGIGSCCPNRNVVRFYCDNCYDGQELCEDCLKDTCRMEL